MTEVGRFIVSSSMPSTKEEERIYCLNAEIYLDYKEKPNRRNLSYLSIYGVDKCALTGRHSGTHERSISIGTAVLYGWFCGHHRMHEPSA